MFVCNIVLNINSCKLGSEQCCKWEHSLKTFGRFLGPGFIFAIMFCMTPERVQKGKIPHPILESLLDRLGCLGGVHFLMFFWYPSWIACWWVLVPKWLPKELFGESFWRLFGDPEAICGKCDIWQLSRTWATFHPPKEAPKTDFLGVVFDACLGSGLEDGILTEFHDFGLHLGVPGETILDICAQGSLLQFLFWFMVRKVKHFGEGPAAVLGLVGLSRSCKSLQTGFSTPCYPPSGVRRIPEDGPTAGPVPAVDCFLEATTLRAPLR